MGSQKQMQGRIESLEARIPSMVTQVDSLDEFLDNNRYAVVEFTSQWCLPCAQLDGPMEQNAQRFGDEGDGVAFGKLDIDQHRDIAQEYDVKAIPLLVSFQDKSVVQRVEGIPGAVDRFHLPKFMALRLQIPSQAVDTARRKVEKIADGMNWHLHPNEAVAEAVIAGLAYNKETHGSYMCPCKPSLDKENICPCKPNPDGQWPGARKHIEENGVCHCGLFVSDAYLEQRKKVREKREQQIQQQQQQEQEQVQKQEAT